jgi:hypothetical protein
MGAGGGGGGSGACCAIGIAYGRGWPNDWRTCTGTNAGAPERRLELILAGKDLALNELKGID